MAQPNKTAEIAQPDPLRLSRVFPVPRALVFEAWSKAEHVKNWFSPNGFTVPEAKVEMRVGGAFEVCMRGPDGIDYWSRGTFVEIVPQERLVIDMGAVDTDGRRLFRAYTEVSFADTHGGCRMDVVQSYTFDDPAKAAGMVAGAPVGWSQTLDKLAGQLTLMQTGGVARSVVHGSFHLERTYDAPPALVYKALSVEAAKDKWFGGGEGEWKKLSRSMDFRVGGREHLKGQWTSGMVSTFDAIYLDIVPEQRIVYTYEMHLGDKKISVSLATLQLKPAAGGKTTLLVTEQGAFLDGYDDAGSREQGTAWLLDKLGASLK